MFWIGKKHFLNNKDFENKHIEINGKDSIPTGLKEALLNLPKDEYSRHLMTANKLIREEKFDEAIASYKEALKLKSDDTALIEHIALFCFEKERYQETIELYSKLIMLKENNVNYRINRIKVNLILANYKAVKEALCDCNIIINESNNIDVVFLRGYCHLLLLDEEKAFEDWKSCKSKGLVKNDSANWKSAYLESN